MYRGLVSKARMRRLYNDNLLKLRSANIDKNDSKDKVKPNLLHNKEGNEINPVNFNNGDHLNEEFHFLLEEENRRSRNANDLPPFLL